MPKSYKVTVSGRMVVSGDRVELARPGHQMSLPGTVPGPETKILVNHDGLRVEGFEGFNISHEYTKSMPGRSFETGDYFKAFIAIGEIKAYLMREQSVLLLSGKKADVLDFCRRTEDSPTVDLKTIEINMNGLQERLPEVRGVWFRFPKGLIRAKAFMGTQLQGTSEFCDAKADGQISTLSFYFEDYRDGCKHPIMITQDGTVVLQKSYGDINEEIDFVMHVKKELLDGMYEDVVPSKARPSINVETMSV
ncbi:hypothetical protein Terro_0590 [Terriglobus roseus DSM 18391]|uniref:Uncharacterized protein n=1 Tax=Terriglobus roseus (strain DSM 18391 / NRRL B-41598 / KBS 63) TaxID=926566 RepID=I3ZCG2_TERRK|nr:hypothetical protein [Terriglobus roseus]AFL86930.1 hypothetical protein Terro_0590 [Terriglobus roseus DSM 18391]